MTKVYLGVLVLCNN